MKIYTSYFGNWKALKANNILMIGVSRYPPKHFNGMSIWSLAPTSDMLNMSYEEYDIKYAKILDKLKQSKIVTEIEKIAKLQNADAIALCCFEKEQTECHRYNIGLWMNQKGYEVYEFQPKPKVEKPIKKPSPQLGFEF